MISCEAMYLSFEADAIQRQHQSITYACVMQETVGIRSHHCVTIATDIKQKVDEELAEAGGPSTSGRSKRVTLCVEGNISAGKSTFLRWISQGHPELADLLEVGVMLPASCKFESREAASEILHISLLKSFIPPSMHFTLLSIMCTQRECIESKRVTVQHAQ